MYAIHTTPGFIIGSRPSGEAGKTLSIFTRDLGLIRASAQGIRFEKSKLRPFVQDYSMGRYSFVKGKEFWRLTNAEESHRMQGVDPEPSVSVESPANSGAQGVIARIALVLGRLVQGEDPHPELFETIDRAFSFLASKGYLRLDAESKRTFETLLVARILHRLGYISVVPELGETIQSDDIDAEALRALERDRQSLNRHINRALRESHL
jgi:recombinational DNA repair protein (RecF pathway)